MKETVTYLSKLYVWKNNHLLSGVEIDVLLSGSDTLNKATAPTLGSQHTLYIPDDIVSGVHCLSRLWSA